MLSDVSDWSITRGRSLMIEEVHTLNVLETASLKISANSQGLLISIGGLYNPIWLSGIPQGSMLVYFSV